MEKPCTWAKVPPHRQYHDKEWGRPVHDDGILFEFLILEGMQAGLSWTTILNKRENMRKAFSNFNPKKIALYNVAYIEELLQNTGIIKNRLKLAALVTNAQAFLKVQEEFGSFNAYIWGFVTTTPIQNKWKTMDEVPASTPLSDLISTDLKKRGFKFVGSIICYAFMQAVGIVNDHLITCTQYKEVQNIL